jgi:hypothetical protein
MDIIRQPSRTKAVEEAAPMSGYIQVEDNDTVLLSFRMTYAAAEEMGWLEPIRVLPAVEDGRLYIVPDRAGFKMNAPRDKGVWYLRIRGIDRTALPWTLFFGTRGVANFRGKPVAVDGTVMVALEFTNSGVVAAPGRRTG